MNATTSAEAPILPKPSGKVRWIVCGLLFAAVVLSYIDRLVLSVLKPDLAAQYHWTEQGYADLAVAFQLTYGVAYVIFGRLVDRVGAKIGYAIAVTLWTIGHVSHIFFTTTTGMMIARLTLAFGEAGTSPQRSPLPMNGSRSASVPLRSASSTRAPISVRLSRRCSCRSSPSRSAGAGPLSSPAC